MTHWGGSIRPWCTYVYLSVTLGKDRTVTHGKDRHIRIYACAHGHWHCQWTQNEMETEETALERRRRLERVLQNISGWLREKAFAAVCTSNH